MNQPSHYQTAFFRELASRPGVSLQVWYARGQSDERRALGWNDRAAGGAGYRESILPVGWRRLAIIRHAWRGRKCVHLINGVWAEPTFVLVALLLVLMRAKFFFHSEAGNPAAERTGWVRAGKHRFARWVVGCSRGMFLIGEKACRYYGAIGIPAAAMFKFSYFVTGRRTAPAVRTGEADCFRICYVGQFVERKRVGDLIRAASRLARDGRPTRLELVGAGPLGSEYPSIAAEAGKGFEMSIRPAVEPSRIPEIIREADVLVLPSAFDGWGLTVNEALQAGVPVVVSEACGVAEVVACRPGWGVTYPAGDVEALYSALVRICQDAATYRPDPEAVDQVIGCRRMTDYFLAVVAWRLDDTTEASRPVLEW